MRADTDREATLPETPAEFDGAVSAWDPWLVAMMLELRSNEPSRLN